MGALSQKFSHYDEQTGEYIETAFNHLNLPDNLDAPVLDGIERTMNLGITRASGWHYADGGMLFIPAYRKVSGQSLNFKISYTNKEGKPNREGLVFEFSNSRSFNRKIPLADIFTVAFGISDADQIRSLVGTSSEYLTNRYLKQKTPEALLRSIKNKKLTNTVDLTHKLRSMITTQTMLDSSSRIYDLLGLHHFIGCSLAESMTIGDTFYEKFTVVDESLVFTLEHSGLDSVSLLTTDYKRIDVSIVTELYCVVSRNEVPEDKQQEFARLEIEGNEFQFGDKWYTKEGTPEHNTLGLYCAVINRLFSFATANINFSMQDYKNQKIITFRDKIADYEREDIDNVQNKIINTSNLLEGVSGHHFDRGRAERLIKNADSALAVITKNENPLAKTSQGNVLVRDVEFLAKEAIQVLPQDLGLIDPVDTPESKNIGKATALTITTEIGEDGSLYTPLYKVKDNEITKEVDMVHVGDLPNLFIAEEGAQLQGNVLAKHQGVVKLFPSHVVTHVRVSPFSSTSACRASSVFMENTDQKRTQMTANAQKQARTILRPSRARIETGIESIAANGGTGLNHKFTVEDIFRDYGVDTSNLEDHIFNIEEISDTGMSKEYRLTSTTDKGVFAVFFVNTEKSSYGASYFYELVAPSNLSEFYSFKDVVYKQHNIILGGNVEGTDRLDYHTKGDDEFFEVSLANGQDLFVMFGFSESFTVDDASVISDRVVRDMSFATPVLVTKKFKKDKIFNKDITEHFGTITGAIHEGYNAEGLPLVGTYLRAGSKWLYKYERNSLDGSSLNKTLRLTDSEHGEVIAVDNGREEIKVTIAKWINVEVGDKFSGRQGNKTIISKVMPQEMMPYHPESGRHVDMIINPLGIPSRGNISQLAELQMSAEVEARGLTSKVVPPFSNELMRMVENYESGKDLTELQLLNPQTGLYYDHKHFCGYMHYLRNAKIAEAQLHAIGDSSEIDVAFLQPVGGSELHEKGQSISSMEKEILVSYGASGILDEIHSVLSADRPGFRLISDFFDKNPEATSVDFAGENAHAEHMQHVALAFHTVMKQEGDKIQLTYMSDSDMDNYVEIDPKQVEYGLSDRQFLNTMMYISIPQKFITPIAVRKFKFASIVPVTNITYEGATSPGWLGQEAMQGIIAESHFFALRQKGENELPTVQIFPRDLNSKVIEKYSLGDTEHLIGMASLVEFLETYPLELWIEQFEQNNPGCLNKEGVFSEDASNRLTRAKSYLSDGGFKKFITTRFPVLPNKYRQAKNEINDSDSLSAAYKDLVRLAQDTKNNDSACSRLYNRMGELLLPSKTGSQRISLFEFMAKKDTGGRIRSKILKTRVLCSMRSTIVPMFSGDPEKYGYPSFAGHPDSIGLPLIGALRIAQPRLLGYIRKYHLDIVEDCDTEIDAVSKIIDILTLPIDSVEEITGWATDTIASKVRTLKKELIDFVNGSLVFYGRAPSLQETSMRGGRVYVHEEKVIHLHSLLTTDLNADHDGDQIYVAMPITSAAVEDIETKLLPSTNALKYNDGLPSLLISQDALLGLYFATEDPASDIAKPVISLEQIKYYLNLRLMKLNDLVVLNLRKDVQVKTTVGRLLVNDAIFDLENGTGEDGLEKQEDGTYKVKFDTPISGSGDNGISISDLQLQIAAMHTSSKTVTDIYNKVQQLGYRAVEMRNLTVGIKDLTPALKVESINSQVKKYVETARTLEELGLLSDDYLIDLDGKVNELISELDIMSNVPEDNAFKILAVSGAKGKKAGIEKMFGIMGFVAGNDGAKLVTPILSNTVKGVSQFQVEDLSYTQRDNAISTVFETSKPGETLRSGAFELSGLIIQPNTNVEEIPQLVYYNRTTEEGTSINTEKLSTKVWIGTDRKTATLVESAEEYHYRGHPLDSDIIRQLLGSSSPHIELDEEGMFLFLDVTLHPFAKEYFKNKMDLDGKALSQFKVDKMLSTYPSHISMATHANEFSLEYGISQKHAGYRIGSPVPYRVGENVGIKSSTATAQPANQLVISKRNMDRAGGLDNGIDLFKAAIQSANFYKNDHTAYELLCPEDGIIRTSISPEGTTIHLEGFSGTGYTHFVKAEEENLFKMPFKTGDFVFLGQTIIAPNKTGDGERPVSPLRSFIWGNTTVKIPSTEMTYETITYKNSLINPTPDLVQLIRFYFMVYLESIYRANKINLDPNHYGAFALQASRFCTVLRVGDLAKDTVSLGYLNLSKYYSEVKNAYPGTVVRMELTKGSDTIMLTAGPVAALCYRDAITVASKASVIGYIPEFGSISKVALGVNLNTSLGAKEILTEQVNKHKVTVIKLEDEGESTNYELTKEEEEDAFAGIDWGNDVDDIFGASSDEEEGDSDYQATNTEIIDVATSSIFGGEKE